MKNISRKNHLYLSLLFFTLISCNTHRQIITYQQGYEQNGVNVELDVNDKANFTFSVSTTDPIALRTFLMQGFELKYSGDYSYTVNIPSAKDVEKQISHHPGEVKATLQDGQEKRPDIRPVVEALNKSELFIYLDGKKAGKVKDFKVEIEPESGILKYSVMLPNIYSMDLPITVNLYSHCQIEREEFYGEQPKDVKEQPFGASQTSQSGDNRRELSLTYYFSKPDNPTNFKNTINKNGDKITIEPMK